MSLLETITIGAIDRIPLIDFGNLLTATPEEKHSLALQIREACVSVGFFYVKNHGLPAKCVDDLLVALNEYFSLPEETKLKLRWRTLENFKGYKPLLGANVEPGNRGDLHEGFEIGWEQLNASTDDDKTAHARVTCGENVWPSEPAGFREAMLNYYHAVFAVGEALYPLFALALDLPETYFDDKTRRSAPIMRPLHYPPQDGPVDDRAVGIGAHTDFECFTILWQQPEILALQVLNSEKQWVGAPPIDGTLVVNIGDEFARLSNDVFKSAVHRAVNRTGIRRYSIPMFFGMDPDVLIEPIPSCVDKERPAKYKPITAGEYLDQRLKAMYYKQMSNHM
ncbi:hypothetical protein HYDPIDRAFT_114132 [Hydnomerulius pinastri MD-312]|uniref:Fe2OG dioxygenase domain-containing protein n=1 Tax=Hydnomerulius pinastri MD-312 TaxID=994086 RepID=A0A0C9W764_9AGAM|nr:hypothetical protein HYDPIDRAFT_114132 [Hydnomerulius pinastri MD-312]